MEKYPNRIRELRTQLGLTQQQLGLRFLKPKDVTVISRWERGIIRPSMDSLLELAHILNVHPDSMYHMDSAKESESMSISRG